MKTLRYGAIVAAVLSVVAGCASFEDRKALSTGSRLYNAQRYEEAAAEYERILKRNPDHWQASYMLALSHMGLFQAGSTHPDDAKHAERALAALENCMRLPAPDDEARQKVEDLYVGLLSETDRSDQAIAYFTGKLAEHPEDPQILGKLGELCFRKGDLPCAIGYLQRRAQATPGEKTAWYSLGVTSWQRAHDNQMTLPPTERIEVARTGIEALTRSVEIDPAYAAAFSYLNLLHREQALALSELGQHEAAAEALSKAEEFERRAAALREAPATGQASG